MRDISRERRQMTRAPSFQRQCPSDNGRGRFAQRVSDDRAWPTP